MIVFVTITSITITYIIYKIVNYNRQNVIDKKLDLYYKERDQIENDIITHNDTINLLKIQTNDINKKIANLLVKKIIFFHKEHQKFNENAIKKIKCLLITYANEQQDIQNYVFDNISDYVDVEQIKHCQISDNAINNNIDEDYSASSDHITDSSDDNDDDNDNDNDNINDDNIDENIDENNDIDDFNDDDIDDDIDDNIDENYDEDYDEDYDNDVDFSDSSNDSDNEEE
jgi:hypothetical protein